ncbi:hypothetical protein KFE25_013475 [Diacronema lutheri]|mgnify:CR=1 FL=1|uniref:Uncharacterized protein n=1 Tax=Diacronema lutheri TaxID=2081491 RepID=A0A8J5XU11_DIALT|nr:hypothetical protein KFE25_013475 [Diacronema lutheri]
MAVIVRHLAGHTAPCVHVEARPGAGEGGAHDLASSGEDGWVRLWDLRSAKAVRALGEPARAGGARPASYACHSARDAHALFAAWSEAVYAFDLRAGGVLLREVAASFDAADEDVCSLAMSADGCALIGGDDGGALHAWNARTGRRQLRVDKAHTSLLSAVVCHPRHTLRAFSAGLDGRICAWSLPADTIGAGGRAARARATPTWACALLDEATASGSGSQQLLNPRLAHAIALDVRGELLAAALGDGSIELRSAQSGERVARTADEDAHAGSASLVGFFPGAPAPDGHAERLWSAGNDKLLRVWAVGSRAGVGAARLSTTRGGSKRAAGARALALRPALDVRLPHKPNWVAALPAPAPTLCVADVNVGALALYALR